MEMIDDIPACRSAVVHRRACVSLRGQVVPVVTSARGSGSSARRSIAQAAERRAFSSSRLIGRVGDGRPPASSWRFRPTPRQPPNDALAGISDGTGRDRVESANRLILILNLELILQFASPYGGPGGVTSRTYGRLLAGP